MGLIDDLELLSLLGVLLIVVVHDALGLGRDSNLLVFLSKFHVPLLCLLLGPLHFFVLLLVATGNDELVGGVAFADEVEVEEDEVEEQDAEYGDNVE